MSDMNINCLNFGAYSRTLTIGYSGGIRIFSINGVATLELLYESGNDYHDVHYAECIDNLVSLVQFRFPRYLILYDFAEKREVKKIEFDEDIISFKINTHLILIRLPYHLHVFDARTHVPLTTLSNVVTYSPVMALCPNIFPTYFAYPSLPEIGSVSVCNIKKDGKLDRLCTLKVSDKNIAQIEFSSSGDFIAAASVDGTVIHVFNVETGQNTNQFCRGLTKTAVITSLFFVDERYLLCSSDSDTVHIFDMSPYPGSFFANYLSNAVSYLPFGPSFVMQRSAIGARIPTKGFHTKAYYWRHEEFCWLAVASQCGRLHMFIVDIPSKQCIFVPTACHLLKVLNLHHTLCQKDESGSRKSFLSKSSDGSYISFLEDSWTGASNVDLPDTEDPEGSSPDEVIDRNDSSTPR